MITSFRQLESKIKQQTKKTIVLVNATDAVMIDAAKMAVEKGLANFILVGNKDIIENLLEQSNSREMFEIFPSDNPAFDAVSLVRQDDNRILMKGNIPTGTLLKAVLNRDTGLRQGALLSHVAVIESPQYPRLLFVSDGGINISFDKDSMVGIVQNASDYVSRFGITNPAIGMMALVEEVNPKIPETVLAAEVAHALQDSYLIEGPIALDVALSSDAAVHKGITSKIAGKTDILIMPNTTAANHLVKGLGAIGSCLVGGVIVGATVPIILLSRSDDAETKLRSILLGLIKA
jgi:phosphate butyryltransferase